MNFFGFFGPPPAMHSFDDLIAYGRLTTADFPHSASSLAGKCPHAVWGSSIASADGVTVALHGRIMTPRRGSAGLQAEETPAAAILESYCRIGTRCLERLNGQFALAILDAHAGRALLAVDPMGVERLTYAQSGNSLMFGLSAEAVARSPGRTARLDRQSIFDYLMLHMIPAPATVFEGVRKLRPGYVATFERGCTHEVRYWKAHFVEDPGAKFVPLKNELDHCLRTAVRDCEPGVRSGAFLSGGLDSSTVVGVMSEFATTPTRTFTIGFGYPDYDELPFSRIANARFGCQANEYIVTGDDIAIGLPIIARAYDEPFGNSSALPVYYCAKLARERGVTHLLAGDGGDELFAGNSRYADQEIFERYRRLPTFLRTGLLEPSLRHWPTSLDIWPVRKARGYVNKANIPLPARLETWNLLRQLGVANVLHEAFHAGVDESTTFRRMQELWDAAPAESSLNHMLYYDWQYTLADNDLRKVQTMSALAGVQVSYPMLHPDVVNLSMRIPSHMKMPGTKLREFYKRAMVGFLPEEIIHKKKHGFGLPFGLWLQESPRLREQIFGNLSSLRSRSIVRPEFISRLLHLHGNDDAKYYGVFIWVLAMLEQWLLEHKIGL